MYVALILCAYPISFVLLNVYVVYVHFYHIIFLYRCCFGFFHGYRPPIYSGIRTTIFYYTDFITDYKTLKEYHWMLIFNINLLKYSREIDADEVGYIWMYKILIMKEGWNQWKQWTKHQEQW